MQRDAERVERIVAALREAALDALVCTLPANVLLLSGYWPVVGTSIALVLRDGTTLVLAPDDERELTATGWAEEVATFQPVSLNDLRHSEEGAREPLAELARRHGLRTGRLGYEAGTASEPSSYAAMHLYGAGLSRLLADALPAAALVPVDTLLKRLKAIKTPREVEHIRTACRIAGQAFQRGAAQLAPGLTEVDAATRFSAPLATVGLETAGVGRAGGFVFCMSGPNAALAGGAYARSRNRVIQSGELVLVHCNSYADGFWTDITRTYCAGAPGARQRQLYEAIFAARAAALEAVRPGVRAAAVDEAARGVLRDRGFAADFTHPTGHGVGFAAIDATALPRLHPKSNEVLESGMVFNIEPALYLKDYDGLRHCDLVTVTATGSELLTPFQTNPAALVVGGAAKEQAT